MKLKSSTTRFTSVKFLLSFVFVVFSIGITFSQCPLMFVTPNGSGLGTTIHDGASIEYAFANATPGTTVKIASGEYIVNNTLTIANDSVVFEGGFVQNSLWAKSSAGGATTIRRSVTSLDGVFDPLTVLQADPLRLIGIKADAKRGFELHDITIIVDDLEGSGYWGGSTYGLYLSGCEKYSIVRCQIFAGKAEQGRDGVTGANGVNGANGDNGSNGSCDSGNSGTGGDGAGAYNGGRGGYLSDAGVDAVQPCIPSGQYQSSYQFGKGGGSGPGPAKGKDGLPGIACFNPYNLGYSSEGSNYTFGTYFVPGGKGETGEDGATGTGGGGGGGGGGYVTALVNGRGNGGGEGGAGGRGGKGGGGGTGGGGAFGVYLFNNGVDGSVIDCNVNVPQVNAFGGKAGEPGDGGEGGNGGSGGSKGPCSLTIDLSPFPDVTISYKRALGGKGGKGATGQKGALGGTAKNGTKSKVVVVSGEELIESISNHNFSIEPDILVKGSSCVNQPVVFTSASFGEWNYGTGANPLISEDSPIGSTEYTTNGYRDIVRSTGYTYVDFVNPVCYPEFFEQKDTSCNSYTWALNGQFYTESGAYTLESVSDLGCMRIDTLNLVINSVAVQPIPDLVSLPDVVGTCQLFGIPPTAIDACGNALTATTTTDFPIISGDTTYVDWIFDDQVNPVVIQTQRFIRTIGGPRIPLIWAEGSDGNTANSNSVEINGYTVVAGDDRILMICLGQNSITQPDSVTFNGIHASLAHGVIESTDHLNNIYFVTLGSGSDITGQIKVFSSTTQHMHIAASDYAYVNQVNPIGNIDSTFANDPSILISGSSGNKFLEYYFIKESVNIDQGSGQSQLVNLNQNGGGQTESEASIYSCYGGVNTMSFNVSSTTSGLHNIVELNFGGLPKITELCSSSPTVPRDAYSACGPNFTPIALSDFPIVNDSVITWLYDNGSGNANAVSFIQPIEILDSLAPVPGLSVLPDVLSTCSVDTLVDPDVTDHCSFTITNDAVYPITDEGINVITWTYEDVHGFSSTQTQNVIIDDTSLMAIPIIVYDSNATGAFGIAGSHELNNFTVPEGKNRILIIAASRSVDLELPIVTFNSITATFVDSISDGSLSAFYYIPLGSGPEITGLVNATASTEQPFHLHAASFHNVDQNNPIGSSDKSRGAITSLSLLANTGNKIIDYFYHINGAEPIAISNQAPLAYNVGGFGSKTSYIDAITGLNELSYTSPASSQYYIGIELNHMLDTIFGQCEVDIIAPGIGKDGCAGEIIATSNQPAFLDEPDTLQVTWTYDDGRGNVIAFDQVVIVTDTIAPVPDSTVLPDVIVDCNGGGLVIPTATDNCSEVIITNDVVFPINTMGTVAIIWSFEDERGNVSTQNQNIEVTDLIGPQPDSISLPDVIAECEVTNLIPPTATDYCGGGTVTVSHDATLPINTFDSTLVTWTFDDGLGNLTGQIQYVVITDATPPAPDLAILPDVNSECDVTSLTPPSATDLCGGGTVVVTHNATLPISGDGTATVITWSYDDGHGNISTQDQVVNIDDVTDPIPDGILLDTNAVCEVTTLIAPTATDNCNGVVLVSHNAALPISDEGTTVVTWTFDDQNGNVITQDQNVIISDTIAPVLDQSMLNDIIADCEVISLPTPTATDNCLNISGVSSVSFPITRQGLTVIVWSFDDGKGNVITQTQNVTITDVTAPVPDVFTLPDYVSECSITTLAEPTATDNCSSSVITVAHDAVLPIVDEGTTVVTWTYDDGHGNSVSQTQNIIIDDVTAPVANVSSLPELMDCESISTPVAPTALDNCSGLIAATTTTSFPITDVGTNIIIWTYDDGNGNVITQNQNAIIHETVASASITGSDITASPAGAFYTWIDCENANQVIPDESNQTFSPSVNGTYAVVVTENNCSDTSDCIVIDNVGLDEFDLNNITIYPNPSKGVFNIEHSVSSKLYVEIEDLQGRTIFKRYFSENSFLIDISEAAKGSYVLIVTAEDGEISRKKIVKQ
jgi:hypothetical protein